MRFDKVRASLELALTLAASSTGLSLEEISALHGVSRSTAERMRNLVADMFGPLERVHDGRIVRFRLPNLPKGVRFIATPTAEELAELRNLAQAMQARDPARASLLDSLSRKISAGLRAADRRRLEADIELHLETEVWAHTPGPAQLCKPEVLKAIRHAILAARLLEIRYRRVGDETSRSYRAVPYGLIFGRSHYLVVDFPDNDQPHQLRLDRIDAVAELEERASRPEGFSLRAYAERSFGFFQEEPEPIELVFDPSIAPEFRDQSLHPDQQMETLADGSLRVTFEAGGFSELAQFLTPYVNMVKVMKPERLRGLMGAAPMEPGQP